VGALTVYWVELLGIVLAVILVFLGIIVVGCIVVVGCFVDIGCVSSIVIQKVVVSRIKPTRMLAFSASKLMHCNGTVFLVLSVFSVFVISGCIISILIIISIISLKVV